MEIDDNQMTFKEFRKRKAIKVQVGTDTEMDGGKGNKGEL